MRRQYTAGDVVRFLEAWFRLALADMRLRILPYRYNRKLLNPEAIPAKVSADEHLSPESLENLMNTMLLDVNRAARRQLWFNMSCLRKSVVIRKKLLDRGVETMLMYGARHTYDEEQTGFSTHAWLEVVSPRIVKGMVIDPSSLSGQFCRLTEKPGIRKKD